MAMKVVVVHRVNCGEPKGLRSLSVQSRVICSLASGKEEGSETSGAGSTDRLECPAPASAGRLKGDEIVQSDWKRSGR